MPKDLVPVINPDVALSQLTANTSLASRGLHDAGIRDTLDSLVTRLIELYEKNQFKECQLVCDQVLHLDPNHFLTLCYSGRCLYQIKKYESSVEVLSKCLRFEQGYYFLWSFRGDSYYALEKYTDAVMDYKKSLEIELKLFDRYTDTGNRIFWDDRSPESPQSFFFYFDDKSELAYFRQALFFEYANLNVYKNNNLGAMEALRSYQKVLSLNSENSFAQQRVEEIKSLF